MLGEGNLAFLLNESWGISSLSLPRRNRDQDQSCELWNKRVASKDSELPRPPTAKSSQGTGHAPEARMARELPPSLSVVILDSECQPGYPSLG